MHLYIQVFLFTELFIVVPPLCAVTYYYYLVENIIAFEHYIIYIRIIRAPRDELSHLGAEYIYIYIYTIVLNYVFQEGFRLAYKYVKIAKSRCNDNNITRVAQHYDCGNYNVMNTARRWWRRRFGRNNRSTRNCAENVIIII